MRVCMGFFAIGLLAGVVLAENTRTVRIHIKTPEGRALRAELAQKLKNPRGAGREVYAIATATRPKALPPTERWDYSQCGLGKWTWLAGPGDLAGELAVPVGRACVVTILFRHVVLGAEVLPADNDALTFEVAESKVLRALCGVSLALVDSEGKPVTDAVVHLGLGGFSAPRSSPAADGSVRFGKIRPGFHELLIWPGGHEALRRWVLLEPGKPMKLGSIRLAPREQLHGVVLDSKGNPMRASVTLRRSDVDIRWQPDSVAYKTETRGDGTWKYASAGPQEYFVTVEAPGKGSKTIRMRGGSEPVEVRLAPGAPVEFRADWSALATFRLVVVRDDDGLVRAARRLDRLGKTTVTLPPGRYSIETIGADQSASRRQIDVANRRLEVMLPK